MNNEAVLYDNYSEAFVFHYENGCVYMSDYPLRGMQQITVDGRFKGSSGAENMVISECDSKYGALNDYVIGSSDFDMGTGEESYFVRGERVTGEQWREFYKDFADAPKCEEYDYNEDNVKNILTDLICSEKEGY